MSTTVHNHTHVHPLQYLFSYLGQVLQYRLNHYLGLETIYPDISVIPFPDQAENRTELAKKLGRKKVSLEEKIIFLTALCPHVFPNLFDEVVRGTINQGGDFPQIGGLRGKKHRGFLPTGETVLFLLGETDLSRRLEVQQILSPEHWFFKERILLIDNAEKGEPAMSGQLLLASDYVDLFTSGKVQRPRFGPEFPAQLLETDMEWDDLVLNQYSLQQIRELEVWLQHHQELMEDLGMKRVLKPGYRVLFHGPPGTGKTLTASLLGKTTGKDVYRVDLSTVVSKYIGETEKNLARLFDRAEHKDWILFFDEADALFGKRTDLKDAHDKYANQEVSYLLQRVEAFDGLIILASNLKNNLDDAFLRRFQALVHFPMPKAGERFKIWKKGFPSGVELEEALDLRTIAQKYELSGADIMNVIQHACLQALSRKSRTILNKDVILGIQREFSKAGRLV